MMSEASLVIKGEVMVEKNLKSVKWVNILLLEPGISARSSNMNSVVQK